MFLSLPTQESATTRLYRGGDLPGGMRVSFHIPFLYLIFVYYGSLVPFHYRPATLGEAWFRFLHMPYLHLGVGSRADLIANCVLYVPLAFFLLAWLQQLGGITRGKFVQVVGVLLTCAFVAASIEFLQIFVAPRTVSLNDIISELAGTMIGIFLWCAVGGRLLRLWDEVSTGGPKAFDAALVLYIVCYLALSLFPFDFFISFSEISSKLTSNTYHPILAAAARRSLTRCALSLILETLSVAPFGLLLGMRLSARRNRIFFDAVLYGGVLGVTVETLQFFMASGVSQGISVLTRIAGVGLGLWVLPLLRGEHSASLRRVARIGVALASVPYLLLLLRLNGLFAHDLISIEAGKARFDTIMLMPFYYHYYTTETAAMYSLFANVAMYSPLGISCMVLNPRRNTAGAAIAAFFLGGVTALFIETGKLFHMAKHPDYTNVLIAAVASLSACKIMMWVVRIMSVREVTQSGIAREGEL